MTNQYVGGGAGPSRMSLLVAVLLVIALMAALLALLLAMGILQFRPPGGGSALLSPTPTLEATGAPLESPGTTAESTAAPTAAPATAAPSPGGSPQASPGGVHIVQPGETLFDIGLLYGVPYGEIAAANNLENPDLLTVGQELIIPVPSSVSPPPGVHVVQSGESISSIAELYGISPTDLAEANGIENWDLIFVGQQLIVPGQGAEVTPQASPES